ncbi:RNA-directed DNA polymerase-like protein [Gossypium australe]|uniref:RNA-directed DNA polymerase-like protein n=1 Tax=Gossypium australe TaxID=47621 RepID=A0A5B6VVZ6_9ROSI|nr:RNA-directed DNA polymerase-like protein [Gossypium australe]
MKEVVKKEIIKWLEVRIIYPISNSPWMSPVQYNQILVALEDQHKKTITCLYDTFFVRDPYGNYLDNLAKVLNRCEEANLVIN